MEIEFSNLSGKKGDLIIAVFDNAGDFTKGEAGKPVQTLKVPVKAGEVVSKATLKLPAGDYAVSTILDENGNGKLDTKFGIPSERFGFSNNPPIKFGAPSYSECEVRVEEKTKLSIVLKKLL